MANFSIDVEKYAREFAAQAAAGLPELRDYRFEQAVSAVAERLTSGYLPRALDDIVGFEDIAIPPIADWLRDFEIEELYHLTDGRTASAFEAKPDSKIDQRLVFRLGLEAISLESFNRDYKRAWSPLVLQPYSRATLEGRSEAILLSMELMPFAQLIQRVQLGQHDEFSKFLNQHVLAGTLFEVDTGKDLAVLKDGTPVFIDPSDLNLKSSYFRTHAETQFDPAWQQEQMSIIYENCQKLGLPEPLSWVLKKESGEFVTKQSDLYLNPFPNRPNDRQTITIRRAP